MFQKSLIVYAFLFMANVMNQSSWAQETIELYAAPTGSGMLCTKEKPGSISTCQEKVRALNQAMKNNIVIYLRGGTYVLEKPLSFAPEDSGNNGFKIIYKAFADEKPVISGGKKISGWSLFDADKKIYRAKVDPSLQSRQLFVNGVRAIRARGPQNPTGVVKTATGFTLPDVSMESWKNINDIEVVSFNNWKMFRLGVESIKGNSLTMKQPGWKNSLVHENFIPQKITWLENAYELLNEEGEWYLDRTEGFLYYKPRLSLQEDMSQIEIIMPVLENLIQGNGTATNRVHDIQFEGLTFSHATWLKPSTSIGYADIQAGTHIIDADKDLGSAQGCHTPGNITFTACRNITFFRNHFTHLGAVGLEFSHGCIDNKVIGNTFQDISSTAIQIGGINSLKTKWNMIPEESWTLPRNNVIQNNLITTIGAEYYDACGITVFYAEHTIIEHNEIFNLPYTGISVGWGWSNAKTAACKNKIRYNRIHNFMQILMDGGGIYTLSAQAGTEVSYNYIYRQNQEYGMLYPDEGSSEMHWHHNVTAFGTRWLHMHTQSIQNNKIEYNFHDTETATLRSPTSVVENNTLVKDGQWPKEAIDIMKKAGLESEFRDLLPAENRANKGIASASSVYSGGYEAAKAIDDSTLSGWSPTGNDTLAWLMVDLGAPLLIEKIELVTRLDIDQPETRKNFEIQISNTADFKEFKTIVKKDDTPLHFQSSLTIQNKDVTPFRYIRAIKTKPEYFYISELRVFGKEK